MPRLPEYLKRNIIDNETTKNVRRILKENCLNTVCDGARCPNKNECYQKNTATFLIMGNVCTRNCRYCNISCEKPQPLDENEPKNIAKAVKELGLKYVVITSVTRDDLTDGGAKHFSNCIEAIRNAKCKVQNAKCHCWEGVNDLTTTKEYSCHCEEGQSSDVAIQKENLSIQIEILTPDFKGDTNSLDTIITATPDVLNHNIEVVERIFKTARPQGDYKRSLEVLRYVKENSNITTKSGLMVGLGETFEDIENTLTDLKNVGCDIVTIGQYIPPSKSHFPLDRFYTLEEFKQLKTLAKKVGIKNYQIGPLVRSSYNAHETAKNLA
jgi:lipoyl synthase